jgi:hypothetical protein
MRDVDENIDVPKILWMTGGRVGRQATVIPKIGTKHERSDFRVEP